MLISSLLFAAPASAASLNNYTDYLSDDFSVLIHYQGSVNNPIRTFGDSLFTQLDGGDFLKPDEQKAIELAQDYFLHNDLLFVMDMNSSLNYLVIPMSADEVDRFVETIQKEEKIEKIKVENQDIYVAYKGDRFAFTYWEGALILTDSKQAVSTLVDQLKNEVESPLISKLSELPSDAFISGFMSNELFPADEMDQELAGVYGNLLSLNDYAWYALRDLGQDHYAVEQYTGWNHETFQAKEFSFDDFVFTPELYKKLPGGDVVLYFEINDVYDYVMKWIDVMELDQLFEAAVELEGESELKAGSPIRQGNQVLDTIENYQPYLELLKDRLGLVVQWTPEYELPYVTLLTEVTAENLDVIRQLNELILPYLSGGECSMGCPEVTTTNERDGALMILKQSLTQEAIDELSTVVDGEEGDLSRNYTDWLTPYERDYIFGEYNGYYLLSNVGNIREQINAPTSSLASNSVFLDYFNKYTKGRSDITYLSFYDLSDLIEFTLENIPMGNNEITDFSALLNGMGTWYTQGTAGNYWSKAVTEMTLPIRSAINNLVPLIVTRWEKNVDQPEMRGFEAEMKYDDLAGVDTSWYAYDLVTLANDKIIDDSQKNFRPNDPISRAEFATLIVRHYGWESVTPTKNGSQIFDDVSQDAWYDLQIGLAYQYGILKGDSTGNTVRPNDPITRAEAAQVLVNVSGLLQSVPEARSQFEDVPQNAWYADAVDRTYEQAIVRGVSETKFEPSRFLTRAEAIVLVNRIRERELRFDWIF